VQPGDVFDGKFLVLRKLGWGHFSTVWAVRDQTEGEGGEVMALKVQKSAEHYTEAAVDEIELLERVGEMKKEKEV
jgi:serine/threonine-protein kinase SRPK3